MKHSKSEMFHFWGGSYLSEILTSGREDGGINHPTENRKEMELDQAVH